MMKHIVLFRRKAGVDHDSQREQALVVRMDALEHQVETVRDWKLSKNELSRPVCWDYVLESAFDDERGLEQYLKHPKHLDLVADLKEYFEWAAVDYTG